MGYSTWIETSRLPGTIYSGDKLENVGSKGANLVKGLGQKTCHKLASAGIKTVGDAAMLKGNDNEIKQATKNLKGVTMSLLTQVVNVCAEKVLPGNAPPEVNHIKSTSDDNPYHSKFGLGWKVKIAQCGALKKIVCITKLVTHIVLETQKEFVGTIHEKTWMFYHDALSLMTADDCVKWMKQQHIDEEKKVTYYDKWILPVLGLNDQFSRFMNKPIGNSPEMMPLDNCLNKDLHESVASHVLMSRAAAEEKSDERIFSLSTPKKGRDAYKRIWCPITGVAPPSHRIIQDIDKVVAAMRLIHAQKGAFVPDLAQRPGDRHIVNQLKSKINGGPRIKKERLRRLKDREDLHSGLKTLVEDRAAGEGNSPEESPTNAEEDGGVDC